MAKVADVIDYLKGLKPDADVIWQVIDKEQLSENLGRPVSSESFQQLADLDNSYSIIADQVSELVSEVYSNVNNL